MKCPKCGKESYKYIEKRKKNIGKSGLEKYTKRKTNETICKKCGYRGKL